MHDANLRKYGSDRCRDLQRSSPLSNSTIADPIRLRLPHNAMFAASSTDVGVCCYCRVLAWCCTCWSAVLCRLTVITCKLCVIASYPVASAFHTSCLQVFIYLHAAIAFCFVCRGQTVRGNLFAAFCWSCMPA